MEDLRTDPLLARNSQVEGYVLLPPCVLFSRIGAGGMGAVYRGHHLNLDIDVAVKCLKPSLVDDDPTFVERFKREARSAARINHQNVIRVFDVAESEGLHYLIMEFVQGETARQRVERKRTLSVPEALEIVYEASLGLGEAHHIGLVHRDIKPDNLLVSVRGQVKVADLGLAKPLIGGGQSALSMAGQVMGTPPYMPPEQWAGGSITPAADVWAMGAVLYYLLAGEEAIRGDSAAAIMTRIVTRDFPDVRELRPEVSDDVAALLARATAKEPQMRFVDARELADAIAQLPEHRISLVDNDAGTTELRTMLSPPPSPQIDAIKRLVSEGRISGAGRRSGDDAGRTVPSVPQPAPEPPRPRSRSGAVLLLLVAIVGSLGYAFREPWFGIGRDVDSRTSLSRVFELEARGRFVDALRAAREVLSRDAGALGAADVRSLQAKARDELAGRLRLDPVEPVVRGTSVTLSGALDGRDVERLVVAGERVPLVDGRFSVTAVVEQADVAVQAPVTEQDLLELGAWSLTFVDLGAVAFAGPLAITPDPDGDGIVATDRIVVSGRATRAGVEVRVDGDVVATCDDDGRFRVEVVLPVEGRNERTFAIGFPGAETADRRQLKVVRLAEAPMLALVAPNDRFLRTSNASLELAFDVDEWTAQADVTVRGDPLELQRDGRRYTATVELVEGINDVEIAVRNVVGREARASLRVTYVAPVVLPPPAIAEVTLTADDGTVRRVAPDGREVVGGPVVLAATAEPAAASFRVNGTPRRLPFRLPLVEGAFVSFDLQAFVDGRRSPPRRCEVALDRTPPVLTGEAVDAVAPGTKLTLRGTWQDAFGIGSVRVRGGEAARLTDTAKAAGSWTVDVVAKDATATFAIVARDAVGNESEPLLVEVPVVVAASEAAPDAGPGAPPALAAAIDATVFTAIGAPNAVGFPPRLRHESGVELVAVDVDRNGRPAFYAAVDMVTAAQWDGGDARPKLGLTGRSILRELARRLPGLDLPTASEWERIVAAPGARIRNTAVGGYREWLRPPAGRDGETTWPIRKDGSTTSMSDNQSDPYLGFRVVLRL